MRALDQRNERREARDSRTRVEPSRSHTIQQRNPSGEVAEDRRAAGGVDHGSRGTGHVFNRRCIELVLKLMKASEKARFGRPAPNLQPE